MKGYQKLKQIERHYDFIKLTRFIYYGITIGIILQIFNLIPSIILQKMIDEYLPSQKFQYMYIGIVILVSVPLISSTLALAQKVYVNDQAKKMGNKLSITLINNLMEQPLEFYKQNNSNELLSYCNKNFYSYLLFWMIEFPSVIVNIVMSIIYFIWLFSIHWSFSFFLLLYIPILKYPGDRMSKKVGYYFKDIINYNARVSEIIGEVFKGIKTVKLNNLQNKWIDELQNNYKKAENFWNKVVLYDNMSGIWLNQFVSMLFKSLCLALGVRLVIDKQMTIGQLTLIFSLSGYYFNLVHQIMYSKFSLTKHEVDNEKLFQYLNLKNNNLSTLDSKKDFIGKINTIKIENASFHYHGDNIIEGIEFEIRAGSWIGLVGESGKGKSTILNLIAGLYPLESGKILFNGEDISMYNLSSVYSQIAYVSQDSYIFSDTIKSNLRLFNLSASDEEIYNVLELVGLMDVVSKLPQGIDSKIGEDGNILSQGEKQRLVIAQALLKDADIYILDEITSHLDTKTEESIRSLFKFIQNNKGVTILSVSHNHNFLKDADIVYELKDKSKVEKISLNLVNK